MTSMDLNCNMSEAFNLLKAFGHLANVVCPKRPSEYVFYIVLVIL